MEQFKEGQELTVEPYFEDIPLGEFLRAYTPFDSKRKLQKLVDRGVVEVNGITRPLNFMLQSGDVVKIGERSSERERTYPDPELLSSEDQLLVASTYPDQRLGTRPEGMALKDMDAPDSFVHKTQFDSDTTLYPVYAVPAGASGVVCLTDSATYRDELADRIGTDEFRLTGKAIVDGVIRCEQVIEEPIGPSEHDRSKHEVTEEGKASKTVVRPLNKFRKFTLVSIRPETSTWDQTRVHLEYIHHPLSVDSRYGYREELKLSEFKEDYREKPFQSERPLIERISLHWNRVVLKREKEEQVYEVSDPEDLEIAVKQLKNHGQ